jgi:predicted dehydrogenase
VIGANGKGSSDTKGVALDHNIVALVDVDSKRLEKAGNDLAKIYTDAKRDVPQAPKLFTDYRKMFDEMSKDIDGVIVSTPDHTHFAAAMWAIKHKKHVCVQKPLCNTIWEIRELHKAAKAAGVVTQMGNQGRTMEGQRNTKEWIEQGGIGTLKEIRLWTNRPIWPQGPLAKVAAQCPENLNWDAWLGVEPEEPYFEFDVPPGQDGKRGKSVHPFTWRGWWQFGSGALGDMGCHVMDATFNILGRRIPEKIEVESGEVTALNAPVWSKLVYHFPKSDKFPALKVTWNDGKLPDGKMNKPERDERVPEEAFNKATSGMMFVGTDGVVYEGDAYCEHAVIFPDERYNDVKKAVQDGKIKKTEARSPKPGNPQAEWAHFIVNGGTPSSNFDYSAPLTEFVSLGNLAIRSGKTIQWDAKAMKVTNVPEANKFIKRPSYRKAWYAA